MNDASTSLNAARWGILLALLGLLFGFGLGVTFGAAEEKLKDGLAHSAAGVLETVYSGDQAAADRVVSKSWSYYKRAHLHAGGMGAVAIALIVLLVVAGSPLALTRVASTALGFGALGYPIFWLLAGARAPGLGGTGAAKESLAWLALPTSGLFTLSVLAIAIWWVGRIVRSR